MAPPLSGGTRDRQLHRDRLNGQPQEREHSGAAGGTRDRLPPARGTLYLAQGMEARRAESRNPAPGIQGDSARDSPTDEAGRA